ncbi:hypothetical protein WUBG_06805 [Wuchereria bancrofti]|uniref:Uncharacterized protein n=1 Tax=Wuchereria bancrofti TaxID=6293 RepID=J9F4L9_WUCBA|nr:hypothetical protein WUBG_06805 [Wuchereria bancrofti]
MALRGGKTFDGVITSSANGPSFPAHRPINRSVTVVVDDDNADDDANVNDNGDDNDNGNVDESGMDNSDVREIK